MGARAPIDAQYTRFLVESYDKEAGARLRLWAKSRKPDVETVESSQMIKVPIINNRYSCTSIVEHRYKVDV